ncbi:MAG: hypothetical protein O3A46_14400, partial [Candidatus Poribacteria bacterium]|nr:hypothetical protein [Candidatus Poribacteria bacterium]
VALPRRPAAPRRVADLIPGGGIAIHLDGAGQRFVSFYPPLPPTTQANVDLRGAEGYFVISPSATTLNFAGSGWSNP